MKLADKTSNIQDVAHSPPEGWSVERRQEYLDWAEEVVNNIPEPHTALLQAFNDALSTSADRVRTSPAASVVVIARPATRAKIGFRFMVSSSHCT